MLSLRKTFTATALALALGGALPAVLSTAQAAGTLNVAINQDPGSWDPIDTFVTFWGSVGSNLYDGLTMRGADLKLQPGLATKWEYLDDNKRLRFTLRQGVKFHNGAPLTSADVLWTWQHYTAANSGWRCASEFDGRGTVKVTGVEAPDAQTVVYHLEKPSSLFLASLARADCGGTGILQKASVKAEIGRAHV